MNRGGLKCIVVERSQPASQLARSGEDHAKCRRRSGDHEDTGARCLLIERSEISSHRNG
jgi:hypothetical protein